MFVTFEINRYQRVGPDSKFNDQEASIAVAQTSSKWGQLPAFESKRMEGTSKRYGFSGNSFVAAVSFGKRVEAKTIITGGQSRFADNAHFTDQAQKYIDGDLKVSRDQAILELSQEFASIGVPYDLTPKSGKMKGQLVKKGQSFHGQNTKDGFALNPPDEVGKALDAQKTLNLQIKNQPQPISNQQGQQTNDASVQNKDMKADLSKQQNPSGGNVAVINNNNSQAPSSYDMPKDDDTSPMMKLLKGSFKSLGI